MQRVSIVGNCASGKSTLARRLSDECGLPRIELDAIHHLPEWTPIDADDFLAEAERLAAADRWVVDGNYSAVVVNGPFWRRADTVVWIALPRRQIMRQVVSRTVRRFITREVLWNGNREPVANFLFWRPPSIIHWAWIQHSKYEHRFDEAMSNPAFGHINFVKLTSYEELDRWAAGLDRSDAGRSS